VATILGAVPLAVASGAGAESQQTVGLITSGGLTLGTLLTLFVVPAFYLLVGRRAKVRSAIEREVERLEAEAKPAE
jgi:multidrug efflux pump